jgi:DnaK suppressor protein
MNTKELNRYRNRLLQIRERLTGAIDRMSEVVLTDDQPPEEHDHKVSENSEKELVLEHDEETIRRQVMEALDRLDRGMFGTCQMCGELIGRERLDAMPFSPYCVGCEQKAESR